MFKYYKSTKKIQIKKTKKILEDLGEHHFDRDRSTTIKAYPAVYVSPKHISISVKMLHSSK